MSLSLDLPDKDYVWMQFSGAWSRERHVKERRLEQGIQSVGSIRGNSSHEHNPFIAVSYTHLAPTDNDCGNLMQMRYAQWKIASMYLSHKEYRKGAYGPSNSPDVYKRQD